MTDLFYLIAFVSPSNSDDKGGKKEYHIQGLTRSFQWGGGRGPWSVYWSTGGSLPLTGSCWDVAGPGLVWKVLLTLTMGSVVLKAGYGDEALQRDLETLGLGVRRPTASLTLIHHVHFSKLTAPYTRKGVNFTVCESLLKKKAILLSGKGKFAKNVHVRKKKISINELTI